MTDRKLAIHCKRAYETPEKNDGYRLLVDRLWPRGISKAELKLDEWDKSLAPSDELRQWFDHQPRRWAAFYQKYHKELRDSLPPEKQESLLARAKDPGLTLVYGSKEEHYNNAVALKMFIEGLRDTGS